MISKVIAQGVLAQDMECVESPQIIKVEKATLFEESSSGIKCEFLFLEYRHVVLLRGMQH